MLRKQAVALGCWLALAMIGPATLRGGDWPRWGGTDGCNMVSGEKSLPATFEPGRKKPDGSGIDPSTTKNVKWIARLGSKTCSAPTIAGGRVFIGTNDAGLRGDKYKQTKGGLLLCLDEQTGEMIWQLAVPKFVTRDKMFNYDQLNLGICSSVTVEGERAYVVTNRGEVLCLDVDGQADGNDGPFTDEATYGEPEGDETVELDNTDADILWRFDMVKDLPVHPQDASNASVLIHGDLLYVCTSNGVDKSHDRVPCPLSPSLIVLEKTTGRLVAADDEKMGTRLFHGLWSNPSKGAVNGRTLVFFGGGEGVCYAFEALEEVPADPVKLKKAWSFDCNPPEYKYKDGKPVRYRDGDKRQKRGNTNDGTFIGPSEIIASPVFYNDRVYVAVGQDPMHGRGKGMLCCIDATKTGNITESGMIWRYDQIDRSLSTVSIADGLLYVADVIGTVHCLDAETGWRLWTHEVGAETWACTLVADGKVYLTTQKGLTVLAAGREKAVLAQIYLGAPSWCAPVAANGVLYIASERYLWAVQGKE